MENTRVEYERIQRVLSSVLFFSFAVGLFFSVDLYFLGLENDISPWGLEYVPQIISISFGVSAVMLILKIWGGVVRYKFAVRAMVAQRLHGYSKRINPGRK